MPCVFLPVTVYARRGNDITTFPPKVHIEVPDLDSVSDALFVFEIKVHPARRLGYGGKTFIPGPKRIYGLLAVAIEHDDIRNSPRDDSHVGLRVLVPPLPDLVGGGPFLLIWKP